MTRWRRRYGVAALIVAVAAATGVPGSAAPLPGSPAERAQPDLPGTTVTLITGDRVELRASRPPTVRPGSRRAGTGFRIYQDRGDTYVLPSDAAALVTAGLVDRRLFNVTKLAELGYDDRDRKDMPLIIAGTANRFRTTAGARLTRELPGIGATAVRADKAQAAQFWNSVRSGVDRIWLDGKVKASLDQSVPQIGAPAAWQAGNTGAGSKVAVLDTGIDTTHADLADAVVQAQDFTGSESGSDDRFGHGTHVASIVTGSGAKYQGVAPDTKLLNGKVLDDEGSGTESSVIAGMDWAAGQGADVVNMSLGSGFPSDGTDPLDQAVNRLTADTGTLFVVAAGNEGGEESISSPAAADAALAVGAVDKSDQLADFSSRGPRWGDGAIKPDITAPGVGIVAARARHAVIGEPVGTDHVRLNGTSMATPHVAGAAAILAGQHPEWNAGQLKAALMGSAQPNPDLTIYQQGAGRVDVARATGQSVRAGAGSLSLGTARWPHADDQPISRRITYHNDGDQPVTLTLTTDVRAPDGASAPVGMFRTSATSLTVPAHGSASADLIADTRIDGPDGLYGGALVATAGQIRLRTPVGVNREVESYDVTVSYLDWDGRPMAPTFSRFVDIDRPKAYFQTSGTQVLRLPKGTYNYEADLFEVLSEDPLRYRTALFCEPSIVVAADLALTMDARDAVPIGFRTDHPEAVLRGYLITSLRDTAWGGKESTGFRFGGTAIGPVDADVRVRPSRTSAPGAYHFDLDGLLAGGSPPHQYHLKWTQDGKVPTTLNRRVYDRDLAEVPARIAAQTPGELIHKDLAAAIKAPGTIIERYSPGFTFGPGGITQWTDIENLVFNHGQQATTSQMFPTKGRKPTQRWNVGPFVPAVDPEHVTGREGDDLVASLFMYSDQFSNHAGDSVVDSGSTRLLRDGVEVETFDYPGFIFARALPPEPATYRLETEAVRSNTPFTTRQTAAWTFRSEHVEKETPLSLLMIRFAPHLDDLNRAPAGVPYAIPLKVAGQPGGTYGKLTSVTVDVSYDDGTTWRPAPVKGRTALVQHPDKAGFVSLRATATDDAGNKVEQTIIHAYQLRK